MEKDVIKKFYLNKYIELTIKELHYEELDELINEWPEYFDIDENSEYFGFSLIFENKSIYRNINFLENIIQKKYRKVNIDYDEKEQEIIIYYWN